MRMRSRKLALLLALLLTVNAAAACGSQGSTEGQGLSQESTEDQGLSQENTEGQQKPEGTEPASEEENSGSENGTESSGAGSENGTESGGAGSEDSSGDSGEELATVYPVTVTDQLGRQVVIEEEPQTIVSGYYISSSLLIALGQQDKLVGIEAKADSRPIYSLAAPELLELPSVGTAKEFDLEGCAALNPDLVILPAKLKETIPALEELGLTVLAVKPEDRRLLTELAQLLGTATNTGARAKALLDRSDGLLKELAAAVGQEEQPSVYLAGNSSFLSTAGAQMYQNSMITQAGGRNVAGELTDPYWAEISYEQLLAWNPDYIILAAEADYTVESVLADEQLAECTAVKEGHVYQIPGSVEAWDSPVPGSVLGSLWLASVLHPESYGPEQYQQAAADFYEEFYGFVPEAL